VYELYLYFFLFKGDLYRYFKDTQNEIPKDVVYFTLEKFKEQ